MDPPRLAPGDPVGSATPAVTIGVDNRRRSRCSMCSSSSLVIQVLKCAIGFSPFAPGSSRVVYAQASVEALTELRATTDRSELVEVVDRDAAKLDGGRTLGSRGSQLQDAVKQPGVQPLRIRALRQRHVVPEPVRTRHGDDGAV